jgi:hypothetical protein
VHGEAAKNPSRGGHSLKWWPAVASGSNPAVPARLRRSATDKRRWGEVGLTM